MRSIYILGIAALMVLTACGTKNKQEETTIGNIHEINISKEQFKLAAMELGEPHKHVFSQKVKTNGTIAASISGKVQVSSKIGGMIQNTPLAIGSVVRKGDRLFTIESSEIVSLQQNYAETFHQLKQAKSAYERLKSLAVDQIAAQKDLQLSESEYRSMLAKCEGLKTSLVWLGIDPKLVEEGKYQPSVTIVSPQNGVVVKQETVKGQYVDPQDLLMELVDLNALQLQLNVFEKDVLKLAVGQKVMFSSPNNPSQMFEAILSLIGKSIDPETKTIPCVAELNTADKNKFVNGMYVACEIVTSSLEAMALPTGAVFKSGNDHFVLVNVADDDKGYRMTKQVVEIGEVAEDYIEVRTAALKNVLVAGGYNIVQEE